MRLTQSNKHPILPMTEENYATTAVLGPLRWTGELNIVQGLRHTAGKL